MHLVAFDFDGTLSDSEMTVLLARRRGVASEVAAITDRAMNGELGYAESLRQRVALLEGLGEADATAALEEVVLREGAADLLRDLDDAGVATAVLTGGFERGVRAALDRAGVTVAEIVANRLVADGGALTGAVEGPLVEGTKDAALRRAADDRGIALEETVAVGDGANDLPMLRIAGLAVGFEPKSAVVGDCDVTVDSVASLRALLEERDVL